MLCGGTGQYVQAAIDDFAFPKGDQVENPVRERWTAYAEEHGNQALWEAGGARSCKRRRHPPNNVRRVVRAFELLEEGASYAEQKQRLATVAPFVPAVQFGLAVEPAILNERIDARVDAMVAAGLVDEVRGLLAAGFRDGVTAPQAIGYKEIVEALDGNITLEEAVQAIKTATRRYGKRQRTWFRRDKRIRWVNADVGDAEAVAAEILSQLETLDAYHG
ncbi:MAG: tRNA (adenosine(37)-N6)-dimethylallyltransferase [Adlercreutzia sp.]